MHILIGILIAIVVFPAVVAFKLWGFPKGSRGRDRADQDGAGL